MTSAVSILPSQQLSVLNDAYRKAVARKRLKMTLAAAAFCAALVIAAVGAEVNLRTLFTYFGNFISYFDRIFTLDTGARVWTDFGEWFWGWQKWLKLLGVSDEIRAFIAAGDHAISRRHRDTEVGAEAVGGVVVNREPPGGIQQKPKILMQGGELYAENGRVLVARQAVRERVGAVIGRSYQVLERGAVSFAGRLD